MLDLERRLKAQSFFMLDENFLLHRRRALRLLELMQTHGKSWMLYVFSSARVLRSYTMEQLVGLGISWVWMGIEGQNSHYRKLDGVDTRELVKELQSHGIRVLGSSIIGLEDHTPENIDAVIEHAVRHETDFHQFMLYTPIPGTPLHAVHQQNGTLLSEKDFPPADTHGQYRFNYRHAHIKAGQEEGFLLRAFKRDFQRKRPQPGAPDPHPADRLAALQNPPRRPPAGPLRTGSRSAARHLCRRGLGHEAVLPRFPPHVSPHAKTSGGHLPGIRVEDPTGRPGYRCLRLCAAPAGRTASGQGLAL